MIHPPAHPVRSKARALRIWIPTLVAVVVGSAGAWIAITTSGERARAAAIDRVKMANDPLLPAQLGRAADRAGADPSEWLVHLARVENSWDMASLSDPAKYRVLKEAARRREHGEDARVAFEAFETCIEARVSGESDSAAAWSTFWNHLATKLRDADGSAEWDECSTSAVKLLAIGLAPSMAVAREAASVGPIDPTRVVPMLESAGRVFPSLPVLEEARIADSVQITALFDAQSRKFPEALDDVRAGLAVARVHQPSFWLLSHMVWALHVDRALDALQAILPLLPRGLDVTDIEGTLTALRPRDELVVALKGERAFGNRVFEDMRAGGRLASAEGAGGVSILERWHRNLVGAGDQAHYLDALTATIERVPKSAFVREEQIVSLPSAFWAPSTWLILAPLSGALQQADMLEARLALARAALTAYRGGAEPALKFIAASVDPFDGKPLRCALSTEGLIAFWSVGPDKVDGGATDPNSDVVWKLRLRE